MLVDGCLPNLYTLQLLTNNKLSFVYVVSNRMKLKLKTSKFKTCRDTVSQVSSLSTPYYDMCRHKGHNMQDHITSYMTFSLSSVPLLYSFLSVWEQESF